MAKVLSSSEIYDLAIKAGFNPKSAQTMTAIAMAESGGRAGAVGDQNNPGPGASSTGLTQINFLPSRDAGNATRDPKANLDPLTNLKNAFKISKGGKDFSPWTTYTTTDPTKSYERFMANGASANSKAAKPLSDAAILAKMKVDAPWLYNTYTNPTFTPAQKQTFMGWARAAAAGKPVTTQEMAAQTYNWPITQIWNANQQKMFQESMNNPGQYKSDMAAAATDIDQLIKAKGLTVDSVTRDKAINEMGVMGYSASDPRVIDLLTNTYQYNQPPTGTTAPTGQVSKTIGDIAAQFRKYGIPVPTDPNQMTTFIKNAIGANGNEQSIDDYAKAQAKIAFPWMSSSIDAGVAPQDYLAPLTTTIANTLGINGNSVDYSDPKWRSLAATVGPDGVATPNSLDKSTSLLKNDPRFGYDTSVNGLNAAATMKSSFLSMMGFGQ